MINLSMLADVRHYTWTSYLSTSCINVLSKGRYLTRKVWLLTDRGKKLKSTESKGQKRNKVKWEIKKLKVNELTWKESNIYCNWEEIATLKFFVSENYFL